MVNTLKINPGNLREHITAEALEGVTLAYHDVMGTADNCVLCDELGSSDMFGNMYREFLEGLASGDPQEVEGHYFAALTACTMLGFMLGIHTIMEKSKEIKV